MDISCKRVYQGCVYHVGVTSIIASTFSRRTLVFTKPIKPKSGNAKANIFNPAALHLLQNCLDFGFLVTKTSSWIVKEVFNIWCWTCMMELFGTCTRVVAKSNVFVLVSITWFCSVILSPYTLRSILVR